MSSLCGAPSRRRLRHRRRRPRRARARPRSLDEWRGEHDGIAGFPGSKDVTNAELLELPCDVLVLAATENQVTAANARPLQTKLVAEGANGPTSLEGDEILGERGIPVPPDILTNAGGVAVSYFEWVQDIQRLFWGRDEIRSASPTSWATRSAAFGTSRRARGCRSGARRSVTSIREVAEALEARGIHPVIVREALMSDPLVLQGEREGRARAAELLTQSKCVERARPRTARSSSAASGAENIVAAVAKRVDMETATAKEVADADVVTDLTPDMAAPTQSAPPHGRARRGATARHGRGPACSASSPENPIARRLAEDEPPAPLEES
jgi:hypothetical protein